MTNRFKASDPQYSRSVIVPLPDPTADSRTLVAYAHCFLERIYRPGYAYKKASVMLSELTPEAQRQATLWEDEVDETSRQRSKKLAGVLDKLNQRFGQGTLQIGAMGLKPTWSMKRGRVTPRYTTRWSDIPKVMAQ